MYIDNLNNKLTRSSENKDEGYYKFIDNFLIIFWEKWEKELFYNINDKDYYLVIENNYFSNKINFIYLNKIIDLSFDLNSNDFSNFIEELYIIDNINNINNINKIYKKDNIEINGILDFFENEIYIKWNNNENNVYINYNNKYYEKSKIFLNLLNLIELKEKRESMISISTNTELINNENNENNENINDISKKIINTVFENICKYNLFNKFNISLIDKFININKNKKIFNVFNLNKIPKLKCGIPKIMHFIWIGKNIIHESYIYYIESWIKNHQDWTYFFWNDNNIPFLINQKEYDNAKTYAMKADILRYELLYFFGGVYIDCDFLCLRNIESLIENYTGFSAYESKEFIAIGIMGFIENDYILENIIKYLPINISIKNDNELKYSIPELTGPVYFTFMWNLFKNENLHSNHYLFSPDYFYSYTFQNKLDNINIFEYNIKVYDGNKKIYKTIKYYLCENENNYAIHTWGYSWKNNENILESIIADDEKILTNYKESIKPYENNIYYVLKYYLSNLININYNFNFNLNEFHNEYSGQKLTKINKYKIVHVMGYFFTGGIERYISYIDKYGNHEKYSYYLLYIDYNNYAMNISYEIKNIKMINFNYDYNRLNKYIEYIEPNLIIDHFSLYTINNENNENNKNNENNENNKIYENINNDKIIYFVHSAICYNYDISKLNMKKAIHLYNEENKHISWNNILDNYYLTLGTELNKINPNNNINPIKSKTIISIIGRVAEEKIPIIFFQKLCLLSNEIFDNTEIHIYGEKDMKFNSNYVLEFDKYINISKIYYHNFIDPTEINKVYECTNILLIPSIYETGSFTCIEALSHGIPIIGRNNYGMKYLINDGINGILCNNDNDILNIIKFPQLILKFDKNIIIESSKKYNISNKIHDLELIIESNTTAKNIVLITSVINCTNIPLCYHNIRTVFNIQERYKHTLRSIETVKKYIPNVEILFCECSDLANYNNIEEHIKNNVDYYCNFYNNEKIKNAVNSPYKGYGEANLILGGISIIETLIKKGAIYNNLFKLSGRYYINNNFDYNKFNNNTNNFTFWDGSINSYSTIFYKININNINSLNNIDIIYKFKNILLNMFNNLKTGHSIEFLFYKYFNNNSTLIEKMHIIGYLSTEGYLFEI